MAQPIYPRNDADPTAQGRRVAGAIAQFKRKHAEIRRAVVGMVRELPYRIIELNFSGRKLQFNAKVYKFDLSADVLSNLLAEIDALIDRIMLQGGEQRLWFLLDYVIPAYQQGAAQAQANLAAQSVVYASAVPDIETIMFSPEYQRRIGYVRAREFELMKGLTADMKKDLTVVLTDGIALGQNPISIAKDITRRIGVSQSRAERIARTEINNSLRQSRMDEDERAMTDLGIEMKLMHVSALSKTTRASHASRHGKLYTITEQRNWWATSPNSINCRCSTVSVILENGEVLYPSVIEKADKQKRIFEAAQ